jgi:hypothetical protein
MVLARDTTSRTKGFPKIKANLLSLSIYYPYFSSPVIIRLGHYTVGGLNHASILKQILEQSLQITTYLSCTSTFSQIL